MDTETYLQVFLPALDSTFPERIWFCGLQGSRSRGEHRADSDIDMVVVLDTLDFSDIQTYRDMVSALPCRELACGFLCGKDELVAWDPSDLFDLCTDTTPIRGSLEEIWSLVDQDTLAETVRRGACAVYHGCVHNMIYRQSLDALCGLLKQAMFVIRAAHFLQSGILERTLPELRSEAAPAERTVLSLYEHVRHGGTICLESASDALFRWARSMVLSQGVSAHRQ